LEFPDTKKRLDMCLDHAFPVFFRALGASCKSVREPIIDGIGDCKIACLLKEAIRVISHELVELLPSFSFRSRCGGA
jgi:hypothetical protein